MKHNAFLFVFVFLIVLMSCTTTNIKNNNEKRDTIPNSNEKALSELSFKEFYFEHNTLNGQTKLIFYAIPDNYKETLINNKDIFFNIYHFESYDIQDVAYSTENNIFTYLVLLKAKNPLMHKNNITEILKEILKCEISVSDLEVSPPFKYIIGIEIPFSENMYYPTGNSMGIYKKSDNTAVIYTFNIANDNINFLIGYK